MQRPRERKGSCPYVLGRGRHTSNRKQLNRYPVSSIVFSRPDGHIPDRVAIAGHGLDALLVVTDHDMGFHIHIFQLEVLQKYFQGGPSFSLVDDSDWRVRPTDRLPIGDLACLDRDDLLIGEGLHRILLMENGADAVAGDGERGEIPFVILHCTRDHADVGKTLAGVGDTA